MNFYSVFKQFAFKLDPEFIHDVTINSAHHLPQLAKVFNSVQKNDKYSLKTNNLSWNFPVGVAAGFDKNALAINFFEELGFGAVEIGTITKLAQVGNPKPRVFRHPKISSVQNAMGFPNQGSERILKNLRQTKTNICIGANIGKNKETTEKDTPAEYAYLYQMFADYSDYLVVNISSPNTPGLRSFQKKDLLMPIMQALKEVQKNNFKPLFIKIAPDLELDDLKMICELCKEFDFSGVVATNTTIQHDFGVGGLSGKYIKQYSQKIRAKTCEFLKEDPKQTIIGVGGIDSYQEIKDFWKQGGSFTQVYTSFIYQGPQLLEDIANDINKDLQKYGVNSVQDLISSIKENG